MAKQPLVSIIMGSKSDWPTMETASQTLDEFGVPHEAKIVSAHRTPDLLFEFAKSAEERGIEVIIAGAGGAAHLPGMCASQTVLPVLGVPVERNWAKFMSTDNAKFGPTLTCWLIPRGLTHQPDICPVALAPMRLVLRKSEKRSGAGE